MPSPGRNARALGLCVAGVLLSAGARAGPSTREFREDREAVRVLAKERIRTAPSEAPRVRAAGELSLRGLHEAYQVAGGTPPVRLENDLEEFRRACADPAKDPKAPAHAARLIAQRWSIYRDAVDQLVLSAADQHRQSVPESQVYWQATGAYRKLREETRAALLFNPPPEEKSLEAAFLRDEGRITAACENGPRKTRAKSPRVVFPPEHALPAQFDPGPFFRAIHLLAEKPPARIGAFSVPQGARTATLREANLRLVFRAARGRGLAYLGSAATESPLRYDYLSVPPDTAYYIENIGEGPLEVEFIALEP